MRIAVDMDDVVVDFTRGILDALNLEYGIQLDESVASHWNWVHDKLEGLDFGVCTRCEGTGRVSDKDSGGNGRDYSIECMTCRGLGERRLWSWLQDRVWLWENFKPVPGALGGLDTLKRAGHDVYLVTSKPEWAQWVAQRWCAKWKPHVRGLVVVNSGESKLTVAGFCDTIVDDKPATVDEWLAAGKPAIMYSRPWNLKAPATFVGDAGLWVADRWNPGVLAGVDWCRGIT